MDVGNWITVNGKEVNTQHKTREAWLMALTERLSPIFQQEGQPIPPKLRVSVGWPTEKALVSKWRAIGQCWPSAYSADGSTEIFISPLLGEVIDVGSTLVHELVHASVGTSGHKGAFKRLALTVGLTGPMRSTSAGERLRERLNALSRELGPYPHAAMYVGRLRPKQRTRMLKIECPACAYTARVAQKWLDVGYPTCPCGTRMVRAFR